MRIIAGKHKGRKVESYEDKTLRPTSGKTRAAVFNILTHGRFYGEANAVKDKVVLDLFCGTGAMGLEALSRGAAYVIFVDQNAKSISIARKNAEHFGEEKNVSLIVSDSTMVGSPKKKCSLVLMDPPYKSGLASKALKNIEEKNWLEKGAIIVVEIEKNENLEIPQSLKLIDERHYGSTKIAILEYLI